MSSKECLVRGFEYEEGSFSDVIHKYIDASSQEELEKIKKEITEKRLNELLAFSEGVLAEFVPHFKERFKDVDVKSDIWGLEIEKWNWIGIVLGATQSI